MSALIESKSKRPIINRKNLSDAKKYRHLAYEYFEKAQNQVADTGKNSGTLHQALESIKLALECNPNDADAYNLLARVQLELGNFPTAQLSIENALELHPRNGGYHYSAGHIALAQNHFGKAEALFRKAIKYAPKETRAEVSLAYTLAQTGNVVEAFNQYRELAKTQSDDMHIRSQLLECASNVKADYYDTELELDLLHYLKWDEMNLDLLASLCSSLLECKFQLNEKGSAAQFDEMSNCPLLISSLRNTLLKSPLLEKLIMALRHELLSYATNKGQLPNHYIPLCEAIAQFGLRCEYLLPCSQGELNMISTIKSIIDQSLNQIGCTPMDISGALSLLAMYEPWDNLRNISILRSFTKTDWPRFIDEIRGVQEELHLQSTMKFEQLTKMPTQKERGVKRQYESFPYPCWNNLGYKNPTHYGVALQHEYPNSNLPKHIFDKNLNVLVAGCGTGRHALNVAKFFKGVDVLAVDISQRSLAYAQRKSEILNINNIKFKLADLTELPSLKNKFNIIECSGVLHHIEDYQKALQNLLSNLLPNGLIKISLYSERARKNITSMRKVFNNSLKSEQQIKVARQAIMHSKDSKITEGIINSDDFYSMSGTVDLLFHEYEKCFTPITIKKMCEEHNLKWLGFSNLNHKIKSNFMKINGNNSNLQCLDNWEEFEKNYPDTFSGMYQFYCQYQPKLSIKRSKL